MGLLSMQFIVLIICRNNDVAGTKEVVNRPPSRYLTGKTLPAQGTQIQGDSRSFVDTRQYMLVRGEGWLEDVADSQSMSSCVSTLMAGPLMQ